LAFVVDGDDGDVAACCHRIEPVARDANAILQQLAHAGEAEQ
jgi:hypothetical protein